LFLPKVNGHFWFFYLVFFFTIIAWGQGYFGLLINKKQVGGVCALSTAHAVAVGCLLKLLLKHRATPYTVG
jgi:apolipoprotein N-acyltransferase